jgi:lactoylglutathione lyase
MEASLRFYQDIVGLLTKSRFTAGSNVEIAFLGEGDTAVELICGRPDSGDATNGNGISLGFITPSLEDTINLLRDKGYETDGKIVQPNPNTRFVFARDPDGFNIQFVQG